jgi:hypothetical protein
MDGSIPLSNSSLQEIIIRIQLIRRIVKESEKMHNLGTELWSKKKESGLISLWMTGLDGVV